MTQIDDILDRLKGQQPELENPDEMLESIMANLPDREVHGTRSEEPESDTPHLVLRIEDASHYHICSSHPAHRAFHLCQPTCKDRGTTCPCLYNRLSTKQHAREHVHTLLRGKSTKTY